MAPATTTTAPGLACARTVATAWPIWSPYAGAFVEARNWR